MSVMLPPRLPPQLQPTLLAPSPLILLQEHSRSAHIRRRDLSLNGRLAPDCPRRQVFLFEKVVGFRRADFNLVLSQQFAIACDTRRRISRSSNYGFATRQLAHFAASATVGEESRAGKACPACSAL